MWDLDRDLDRDCDCDRPWSGWSLERGLSEAGGRPGQSTSRSSASELNQRSCFFVIVEPGPCGKCEVDVLLVLERLRRRGLSLFLQVRSPVRWSSPQVAHLGEHS